MNDGTVWPTPLSMAPADWQLKLAAEVTDARTLPVDYQAHADHALVAAAVDGHTAAFDVLVQRHRRQIYHVCFRFVGQHEDASDLTQETFIRAWRGLRNFKGQSAVATWLYRIAVNVSLNRVAVKRPDTEPIEPDQFVDTASESPREGLLREERAATVRRAIAALPKRQRATLILRTYHDLSHREIAEILGSSVGAVKANFFHALANLKKNLGRQP